MRMNGNGHSTKLLRRTLPLGVILLLLPTAGCDLCAIYNADSARGTAAMGFSLPVSEQFIPYDTLQLNGRKLPPSFLDRFFLDRSMTHLAPTWNFSERFGVSASLPVIYQRFRRIQLLPTGPVTG